MKKLFAVCLLIMIVWVNSPEPKIDVDFTPSDDCEQKIGFLIENSQRSINIAMYSLNNEYLVKQLKEAHDRGVKIRILADKLQASNKYSKIIELKLYGLDVKVHTKNKLEHNKFAIFDGAVVSTGSFNWTNAASQKNSENCVFFSNAPESIDKFKWRFEKLWQDNSLEKSDAWFNIRIGI